MFDSLLSLAGPLIGGFMQNESAQDAASGQVEAANRAADMQYKASRESLDELRRQYDLGRADLAPYRALGGSATVKLRDLLGLGGVPSGANYSSSASPARSLDQIRSDLLNSGRFGSAMPETGIGSPIRRGRFDMSQSIWSDDPDFYGSGGSESVQNYINQLGRVPTKEEMLAAHYGAAPSGGGIDEAGLNAEAQRLFDLESSRVVSDANFTLPASADTGSLLRDFALSDFEVDPGYAFRQSEGEKAVERAARARGTSLSPMTIKELLRFNSGLASQEYGDAFNRDAANKSRKFNFLSGAAGTGQTASNTGASMGSNYANSVAGTTMGAAGGIGNLITGAANARGAAGIAGGNALGAGFAGASNAWNQNKLLDQILNRGGTGQASGFNPSDWLYGMVSPT